MEIGKQKFSNISRRDNARGRRSRGTAKFFYIVPDDCAFSIASDVDMAKFCQMRVLLSGAATRQFRQ
jgi:hypothetical protein